jgi:hypothetical protein
MSSINAVSSPNPFPQASPVTLDAIPASPPAEVLSQMATAAGAQDRLAASGQALHFSLDETTGKLTTQLTDLSGNVLGSVSPSTVLDITADGS